MDSPEYPPKSSLEQSCNIIHTPYAATIEVYRSSSGKEPFTEWVEDLRDHQAKSAIRARIARARAGNLGDHKSVGQGVTELRIRLGPGYRVYIGQHGASIIVLLCGGDKSSQSRDIAKAQDYWQEWKRS